MYLSKETEQLLELAKDYEKMMYRFNEITKDYDTEYFCFNDLSESYYKLRDLFFDLIIKKIDITFVKSDFKNI